MGKQCKNPYECDFEDYCMKCMLNRLGLNVDVENDTTVLNFYRMAFSKKVELLKDGKVKMDQIKDADSLTNIQQIQINNFVSKKEYIDKAGIRSFLNDNISYPLYFLDFETAQYAVPQYKNSRPYQQIHSGHSATKK